MASRVTPASSSSSSHRTETIGPGFASPVVSIRMWSNLVFQREWVTSLSMMWKSREWRITCLSSPLMPPVFVQSCVWCCSKCSHCLAPRTLLLRTLNCHHRYLLKLEHALCLIQHQIRSKSQLFCIHVVQSIHSSPTAKNQEVNAELRRFHKFTWKLAARQQAMQKGIPLSFLHPRIPWLQ